MAKRTNFIGIQHSHGVACNGYKQSPLRTGYEQIIPHRTSALYATTAKKPGKVVSVTDNGIVVQYDDGETKGYPIGREYGKVSGMTIPHEIVTPLKVGNKFNVGDVISYNSGFFEPDILNPKQVVWMNGAFTKVALMESPTTLEDASEISQRLAGQLVTKLTRERTIIVDFDQAVRNLVKVGSEVDIDDSLCLLQDALTTGSEFFSDEDIEQLQRLGSQSPKSKYRGTVERIEVFYHGDKEDMHESLRKIANEYDRALANRLKSVNRNVLTGEVDEGFRIDGNPLALDQMAIRIYITTDEPSNTGDC